jgi:hypothetical protein
MTIFKLLKLSFRSFFCNLTFIFCVICNRGLTLFSNTIHESLLNHFFHQSTFSSKELIREFNRLEDISEDDSCFIYNNKKYFS